MARRMHRIAGRAALGGALLLLAACELGTEDPAGPGPFVDDATSGKVPEGQCGAGAVPSTCVKACGLFSTGERPSCVDGRWTCSVGVPDTSCPSFRGSCEPSTPCGYGYTCVKSLNHPVPADEGVCRKGHVLRDSTLESCSSLGTVTPGELSAAPAAYVGQVIKVAGTIGAALECSTAPCPEDDPCCKACGGNYVIHMTGGHSYIEMVIKSEAIACAGNNCTVSCSPLLVGDTYTLWGILDGCSGNKKCTMLYMDGCPL